MVLQSGFLIVVIQGYQKLSIIRSLVLGWNRQAKGVKGNMSQVSDVVLANQGFASFRTELNNIIGALNTMHIGSSAPGSVATGTIWVDNGTSNTLKVKINDGSDNIELFSINTSTNAISSTMSVTGTIAETDPQAAALAIALG